MKISHFPTPVVALFAEQVVNAWAKSELPEGPEKAEAVFRRMEEAGLKPNTISFNTVINAWANRRDPVAARRAKRFFFKWRSYAKRETMM